MSLIIDIIILAILALFTFIGYKQGLIKSAIKILTFFLAIIVSVILYKPVANLIVSNTNIDESIQTTIVSKILPEGMHEDDISEQNLLISSSIMDTANKTIKEIGQSLAVKIIEGCTFLILFIVLKIALVLISILSNLITKLPVIKQLDKTGGTIYGIIKGLLVMWAALAIISLISPLLPAEVIDTINKSIIGALFYKYNLLLILLF